MASRSEASANVSKVFYGRDADNGSTKWHRLNVSASFIFKCPGCGFEIEAWDDGHPFIVDDFGERHFFYHPGERDVIDAVVAVSAWAKGKSSPEIDVELSKHTGCMRDALCDDCGAELRIDSEPTSARCPACGSEHISEVLSLVGKRCPKCKANTFPKEPMLGSIS